MTYDKNIENGSDGAMVYWRVKDALAEDPFASMLSTRVLEGLAKAVHKFWTDADNKVDIYPSRSHIESNIRVSVLRLAPISWIGEKPLRHLSEVMAFALIPEPDSK